METRRDSTALLAQIAAEARSRGRRIGSLGNHCLLAALRRAVSVQESTPIVGA